MKPIVVRPNIVIPPEAIEFHAVRARGPGGQNVNKVASKVELRVDLDRVSGLDDKARARLRRVAQAQLDADGLLLVTSQRTRDQPRNLEDARQKVRAIVLRALVVPKRRRATKPSRVAIERRLQSKRLQSRKKKSRRKLED